MGIGGVDGNWGNRWKLEEKMGMKRRRWRGEDRKMNLKRIGGVDWNGKERGGWENEFKKDRMSRLEWEGEMGMGKRRRSGGDQNRSKKGMGGADGNGKEKEEWGR
jgi:hypothetical protein